MVHRIRKIGVLPGDTQYQVISGEGEQASYGGEHNAQEDATLLEGPGDGDCAAAYARVPRVEHDHD